MLRPKRPCLARRTVEPQPPQPSTKASPQPVRQHPWHRLQPVRLSAQGLRASPFTSAIASPVHSPVIPRGVSRAREALRASFADGGQPPISPRPSNNPCCPPSGQFARATSASNVRPRSSRTSAAVAPIRSRPIHIHLCPTAHRPPLALHPDGKSLDTLRNRY